jgi:hypothetical protein
MRVIESSLYIVTVPGNTTDGDADMSPTTTGSNTLLDGSTVTKLPTLYTVTDDMSVSVGVIVVSY